MALGDGIRRNVATISQEERDRLRDAIIALNHRSYPGQRGDLVRDANGNIVHGAGGVTYWFKQDEIHQGTHVHGGPAFLTWHRELCNRFEALLREVDPQVSLHYWDWTTDPTHSPDGQGGFVNLFTPDFMGAANGSAGEPWQANAPQANIPHWRLDGFYVPDADPFRSDLDFSTTDNAFDPSRTLERQVAGGIPNLGVSDAQILAAEAFPDMRQLLEGAHNASHGYIGGTLGDPHRSFRDPFVFLLHSNVDRLFASWQLQPGKDWRLNPEAVYGTESNTVAVGRDVGILTPLEPWAGVNAPGAEFGVQPVRPWADPENEQLLPQNQKNSKHRSVVMPPRYDTSANIVPHSMWHTIRHADGSWQPFFGDVEGQTLPPGVFDSVDCASINGELHVCGTTREGEIWHTIRHADGSWQPIFDNVKDMTSDPGPFVGARCAGVNGELHICGATTNGGMWHTIRHADGSWQPFFGDVKGQTSDPGPFSAVGCAGVNGELHVCGVITLNGGMWHTIRHADGSWQPFFGDVKGAASNPGPFLAVGCAGINGELHVCGVIVTNGGIWHTIRHADGSWQPFGDVKSQTSDPGRLIRVGCAGIGGELHVSAVTLT